MQRFPLALGPPVELARILDSEAQRLSANLPFAVCQRGVPTRDILDEARSEVERAHARMIALQEEGSDWRCYRLYSLREEAVEHAMPPPLRLGERAFEIVMARRMVAGEPRRPGSNATGRRPCTELPARWPAGYRT